MTAETSMLLIIRLIRRAVENSITKTLCLNIMP
nr:MAG TPA: hypothetical protein [Caudoviricetes sp.]